MANFFQKLINGIKINLPLIIRGSISGFLLMLGPLLAILMHLGGANPGVIIIVGLISEIIGLGGFWLVIRKDFFADQDERKESPFESIRSRLHKSKDSQPEE